ncbi:MAG: hypothetical protein KDH94_06550, partial [Coxiellaceae bacterium]|nr:hypothetical protein [Coxiellaceae bacterium]
MQTPQHRDNGEYTTIKALGDDRCLFNSFVLGLVDHIFTYPEYFNALAKEGRFAAFLQLFDCNTDWDEFVGYLYANRQDRFALQQRLSRVLRRLFVDHLMETPTCERLCYSLQELIEDGTRINTRVVEMLSTQLNALLIDFDAIVSKQQRTTDLYLSCPEIVAEFERHAKTIQQANYDQAVWQLARFQVLNWYCHEGGVEYYKKYLAQDNTWGGANEARAFAQYFCIAVKAREYSDYWVHIYDVTKLTSIQRAMLSDEERRYLETIGVLEKDADSDGQYQLHATGASLRQMLQPMGKSDAIIALWLEAKNNNTTLTYEQCREILSDEDIQQLHTRNILNRVYSKRGYRFNFSDVNDVRFCLAGVSPDRLALFSQLMSFQSLEQYCIHMTHNGLHWDYLQKSGMAWQELREEPIKNQLTCIADLCMQEIGDIASQVAEATSKPLLDVQEQATTFFRAVIFDNAIPEQPILLALLQGYLQQKVPESLAQFFSKQLVTCVAIAYRLCESHIQHVTLPTLQTLLAQHAKIFSARYTD